MKQMIGKNIKNSILFLVLITINTITQAAVTAQVDRTQVVIGETFNLVISIDENTNEQPDLSVLEKDFRVLGNSQSSSTNIVNNNYSVEKKWQISLMSLAIGEATIPPIKIGNQFTDPIKITTSRNDPNAKANGDIFIEIETDKKSAFVKEQIVMTVKLFYSISLSEGSLSEPIASGAIVTQLDKGANYRTVRDGKTYEVIERHYAMFAEKSGNLEMNPIIFNGRDNTSRRSFSMFSTGKPVRAVSEALSFEIKPIPQSSIGKDWLPATNIQVSQEWSDGPYKAGEPITRTITLYIEGLSETQIPDIELGDIEDIRVYPERPQTQTENTSQTVKSYKQAKLALIPTHKGSIRIPEYSLEWYNTKTNQIEYAKLPPVTLQVEAGDYDTKTPAKPDVKAENKVTQPSEVVKEPDSVDPKLVTKVVEKDNTLWKGLTAFFALLWLITTIFLMKKPTSNTPIKSADKIIQVSKRDIIEAIQIQNIAQIEKSLLAWWNQQYSNNQVSNISQIKTWVNPTMQTLINDLENHLYSSDESQEFKQVEWLKQVKGNGLKLIKPKQIQKTADLPGLY